MTHQLRLVRIQFGGNVIELGDVPKAKLPEPIELATLPVTGEYLDFDANILPGFTITGTIPFGIITMPEPLFDIKVKFPRGKTLCFFAPNKRFWTIPEGVFQYLLLVAFGLLSKNDAADIEG